jgi:CCR4-NOT transcription complex subunit 1
LVQTLCELGPDITKDSTIIHAVLQRFGILEESPPTTAQVIELISTLSKMAAEGTQLCDPGNLIRALASLVCR